MQVFGVWVDVWVFGWSVVGFMVLVGFLYWLFAFNCPECRTRRTLEWTGTERSLKRYGEKEFRCRRCGHTVWRRVWQHV